MPRYTAGIVLDGWLKLQVDAMHREAVKAKLATARLKIEFVDVNHELVGKVIDPQPVFEMIIEEVEVYRPDQEKAYHAPVEEEVEVDLT